MSEAKTIIVTGATGFIGREVCRRLTMAGNSVIAFGRRTHQEGPWAKYKSVDITGDSVIGLTQDPDLKRASAMVHCAAHVHRMVETGAEALAFERVNVLGTRQMLGLASALNLTRFVYVSSIAVYKWVPDRLCVESDPVEANSSYAKSKLAAEGLCASANLEAIVVRLGTAFGIGDTANFARMAKAMSKRRFLIPGGGQAKKSIISVGLAGELLADIACKSNVGSKLLNVALPVPYTLEQICENFARLCGFPRPPRVPICCIYPFAAVGTVAERLRFSLPINLSSVRKLCQSTAVDTRRMLVEWPDRIWPSWSDELDACKEYYMSANR